MNRFGPVSRMLSSLSLLATALCSHNQLCSQDVPDGVVDFQQQIVPILQKHCVRCHSPDNEQGSLSLTTFDDLQSNDYVIAGSPSTSHLLELVESQDGKKPEMPKQGAPLSRSDVQLLRNWITQGALWPTDVSIPHPANSNSSWWAYQPLRTDQLSDRRAALSHAEQHPADAQAAAHVIDSYIREALDKRSLSSSPQAE